jgi:hypothetical protein
MYEYAKCTHARIRIHTRRREGDSTREINEIRAKIELERTRITSEREAISVGQKINTHICMNVCTYVQKVTTHTHIRRREGDSTREINEIRAKIELERTRITSEREAISAERMNSKAEWEQVAAEKGKMMEGRIVLEREMKQMRDLALDLENKASEVCIHVCVCVYIYIYIHL